MNFGATLIHTHRSSGTRRMDFYPRGGQEWRSGITSRKRLPRSYVRQMCLLRKAVKSTSRNRQRMATVSCILNEAQMSELAALFPSVDNSTIGAGLPANNKAHEFITVSEGRLTSVSRPTSRRVCGSNRTNGKAATFCGSSMPLAKAVSSKRC